MTTATVARSTPVAPIPFSRNLLVELRKMVDTLAGRWLLIVSATISIGLVVVAAIFGDAEGAGYADYVAMTAFPLVLLLPIVGTMAATAEWSQRAGLTTFALEPRRGRVVVARSIAGLVLSILVLVVAFAGAAATFAVMTATSSSSGTWSISAAAVLGTVLALSIATLQGVAFGFAFLNTPVAIVLSLLLPSVWTMLSGLSDRIAGLAEWLDLGLVVQPLMEGTMTGESWAHLGTATAAWVALPMAVGAWRVMSREVK